MRKLLTSVLLFILASRMLAAPSAFQPDQQLTNEINQARARLNGQQLKLTPAELNRLAETLGRSNRFATVIVEAYAKNDFTNAAALLKEFPGSIDDLRQYGQPLLIRSVVENLPDKLDFLLAHKADPDLVAPFYGGSALIQAISYRRWDLAVKLVQAGASPTRTNDQGRSAATMVFENWYPGSSGNDAVTNFIPLMLEHGLDPFAAAARPGQPQTSILEECLSREIGGWGWNFPVPGAIPSSSTIGFSDLLLTNKPGPARRTPLGDTALHIAARWQHTNAIEFLLNAGFNIDQTNDAGLTPLQSLAGAGALGGYGNFNSIRGGFMINQGVTASGLYGQPASQFTMVDYLLAKGATLDVFSAAGLGRTNELAALLATNAALANARDGYGRTPLHYATLAVRQSYGAPVIRVGPSGRTIVMNTAFPSNPPPDGVSLLLTANANPSAATTRTIPQVRNSPGMPAGTTPLHLAARNANTTLIRTLLAARADAKLTDENGDSPLHLAARTWATNALPLLIAARAPLEATNHAGQTPLRAAVESGYGPVAGEVLLKAGASLTNGLGGNTLLHIAAERDDIATATMLLKHGLALDARDDKGRTPFQKAVAAQRWNSILFLKNEGANINAIDNAGDSALHLLSARQDDTVNHMAEEPSFVQWERKQLSTPGWTGRGLGLLIRSKIINSPPPQIWTNTSLTSWLVEQGAKVNATNRAGQTPLHVLCSAEWARWYGDSSISNRVISLLNDGASLDVRDTNGLTPLGLAAECGIL